MDNALEIPTVPLAVVGLLNFFAPYAVAILVDPRWTAFQKRVVSVVLSVVLAVVTILFAVLLGGYTLPAWPVLIIVAIVVAQASYALILKGSADKLARSAGTGTQLA